MGNSHKKKANKQTIIEDDYLINNIQGDLYKVVVGIDFGTSGIGYAYSFHNNLNSIVFSIFPGQTGVHKVPSEIILDNKLENILAFGNECKGYIKANINKREEYQYFKNIKMNLYNKIYEINSTNGKKVNIEIIISKILEEISKNALSQIQNGNHSITKKDIKWVVTIPAIWEEKSKKIMIDASIKAGLIEENDDKSLFLALEPEVAGIYYYLSSESESEFKDLHISEGKPYIICDIGAGTVDICTHRKVEKTFQTPELYEEYPPIGGDYGGNKINEVFIKRLIIKIFGEEKVKTLRNNSDYEEWDKFEKEIEQLKISAYNNFTNELMLDCSLFEDESDKKTLDDYILEYNKNFHNYKISKKKGWKLLFPPQIFYDISEELSQNIFSLIEKIYNKVNTGYIIATGAGSYNYTLMNHIYKLAQDKNMQINVVKPPQPEISIVKGAVLFGFQDNIIRKRKARYTFGIKASSTWEEKYKDKGIKEFSKIDNEYKCSNLFSRFITINQYIQFDEVLKHKYNALNPNPEIILYRTKKENCTFID